MNLVFSMNALITIADSYDDLPGDLVETLMAMDFKKMDEIITRLEMLKGGEDTDD